MIRLTMQPGAVTWRADRTVGQLRLAAADALGHAAKSYVKSVNEQIARQMPMSKTVVGRYRLEEMHLQTRAGSVNADTLAVTVFNPHIYARLREKGGTVYPRHRKLLAVPMNYAAQTLQLSIHNPDPTDPVRNSLYNSPLPLVFVRRRDGKMFLLPKETGHGLSAGLPAYSLHHFTVHKPHPFMAPAMTEGYPEALAAFAGAMRRRLGAA